MKGTFPSTTTPQADLVRKGTGESTTDAKWHQTRPAGRESRAVSYSADPTTLFSIALRGLEQGRQGQDSTAVNTHGFISPSRSIRSSPCPSSLF